MITNSVLKIYSDKFCQNLYETVTVSGSDLQADTSTLLPGKDYYATVTVTDSEVGVSAESAPYKFYSLPNIVLSGSITKNGNSFTRPTTITTDIVGISDFGLQVTTDPNWASRPVVVSGNTVDNLTPHTTYYYRPWVKDEFGRTYVNTDDVASVMTNYNPPVVKIIETYTPTTTGIEGRVYVESAIALTSVTAYTTTGGTTTTTALVAMTGEQDFEIEGLQPFTKYALQIKAVNAEGEGESQIIYFTTAQEQPSNIDVEVIDQKVSPVNNIIKTSTMVKYDGKIEVTDHDILIYDNKEHEGTAEYSFNGGANDVVSAAFDSPLPSPDTDYYIFGYVEYDNGGILDTQWSDPMWIHTYSLITLDSVTAGSNSATIEYTVYGYSSDTQIEYSTNQQSWTRIPLQTQQSGTVTINNLSSNTTYYLRARVGNSERKYCNYVTDTFTTETLSINITGFTRIEGGVEVGIQITQH